MSTLLSSKDGVKARKPYRCCLCGTGIAAGDRHNTRTGANRDGIWTMRMHSLCEAYEQSPKMGASLHDNDWYEDVSEPAFERAEAVRYAINQ